MATSSAERGAPPRLLCVAPSWLGDAILSRPALAWLAGQGFELELLVREGQERALADLPGIRTVHVASASSRLRRLAESRRLRRRDYSAALVLPPSFSSALMAFASAIPLRVGFATQGRALLLQRALPVPSRDEHLAVQYLRLAHALVAALRGDEGASGAFAPTAPAMPALVATDAERGVARGLLDAAGIGGAPYLVIAPGARYGPAKQYPAERFAAAAAALVTRFAWRVVLVGARSDAAATRAVAAALPESVDLAGRTSLDALVGLLADSRGVLANDSGTMHLAAALGRPVVGVFGSTNPLWTAPLGARAGVVVQPVWCAPCYAPTCVQDFGCMLGIAPARLAAALVERLESPPSPAPRPTPRV